MAAARIADCLRDQGYRAALVHDDGRVSLAGEDPDVALLLDDGSGSVQVRDPSDSITVSRNGDWVADIGVPATGSLSVSATGAQRSSILRCTDR